MTDLPSPELLWSWGEMQDRIDLAVGQETDRIAGSFLDPIDVPPGVEADLEQDRGEKEVVRRPLVLDRYRLALEVPDRPDTLRPEQLKASDVGARQHDDRVAGVDTRDERRDERHSPWRLATRQ